MAQIRPFAAVRYARNRGLDLSTLITPPYDVLDEAGKLALQKKNSHNLVTVDLPHLPAKSVGPDETYAKAAATLRSWMADGILQRDTRSAIYAYAQTYSHGSRKFHRRGMFALVKLSPFGQGQVIPHEKTYPDAIHDRLKLTRATKMQLSPIFGLFSDPKGEVNAALYKTLEKPEVTATLDGVQNDLWPVTDSSVENTVIDLMGSKPIYIADGHHRYTMALQYQKEAIEQHGAPLPPNHPANFCMFALVGMQDEGLLILPTHRILSGLKSFDVEQLKAALAPVASLEALATTEAELARYIDHDLARQPGGTFGLFDGKTRRTYQIKFHQADVLRDLESGHAQAWRELDVAILQHYLIDHIIKPKFAGGADPKKSYTADSSAVAGMTDGAMNQIALILRSTPLRALEDLGKVGEVMPQKSTYFFPKLATGMVINPLE